jgi:hypothetical protein
MLSRSRFSELSDSLSSGFFADNAVLVLSKIRKRAPLLPKDQETLTDVLHFLTNVLEGFKWSENPHFSRRSASSALAFSQAARASTDKDAQRFHDMITNHMNGVKKLLSNKRVDPSNLNELVSFFSDMGRTQLARTDNIINVRDSRLTRKSFSL